MKKIPCDACGGIGLIEDDVCRICYGRQYLWVREHCINCGAATDPKCACPRGRELEERLRKEGIPWDCTVPAAVLDAAMLVTEWCARMGFQHWRIAGCASPGHVEPNTDLKVRPSHVSAKAVAWNYNMEECPRGVKCLLLNAGGVAVFGPLVGEPEFFRAWAPMPQRDKEEEKRRDLHF